MAQEGSDGGCSQSGCSLQYGYLTHFHTGRHLGLAAYYIFNYLTINHRGALGGKEAQSSWLDGAVKREGGKAAFSFCLPFRYI